MTRKPFGPWPSDAPLFLTAIRFLFGLALILAALGLWMAS